MDHDYVTGEREPVTEPSSARKRKHREGQRKRDKQRQRVVRFLLDRIDLPPTHKPPPPYSGRAPAVPLGVHASQVAWLCQTRRAERRCELTDGQHPSTTRPGPPGTQSPTLQLSRLEWVCHRSGTDQVYINHREHYV